MENGEDTVEQTAALEPARERFGPRGVLAPWIWQLGVWLSMFGMLGLVGYLTREPDPQVLKATRVLLATFEVDHAARRATLAFSGVTLAITVALSAASVFWAWSARVVHCDRDFAIRVVWWVLGSFVGTVALALVVVFNGGAPFTTEMGNILLEPTSSHAPGYAAAVPYLMFFLSCAVPSILLAGACFLLGPPEFPPAQSHERAASHESADRLLRHERFERALQGYRSALEDQLGNLRRRLRELDQMLYIGALALVFGTLQLSAGLSVPLASLPKKDDVKLVADLCKTILPVGAGASAVFGAPKPDTDKECKSVQGKLVKLEESDGLRELARGVTLSFGLAFSAMLAAIYVPTLLVLREKVESRQRQLPANAASGIEPVDPVTKIGAVVATLSPLLAGLIANIFAGK